MLLLYRARWSFVDQTRPLLETGRLMARFGEAAARSLAPDLEWRTQVEEHADFEMVERWEASHVVTLYGGENGLGASKLQAGGRGRRVGGMGRVTLSTASPTRFLEVDGHCDVTHWDVRLGGVSAAEVGALRAALEAELGAGATESDVRTTSYERGPREIARTTDEADALLWAGDLDDVGLIARSEPDGEDFVVRIESSEIATIEDLEAARITLGEVLAEAGHEDWTERADELLVQLQDRAA